MNNDTKHEKTEHVKPHLPGILTLWLALGCSIHVWLLLHKILWDH